MTGNDEADRRGAFSAYVLLFATLYAGFGVMSPFLPALLQARGLRPEDIGLALALSTIVRLVTGPVAGRVADRLGALRSVFAASATAAAVCGLGFLSAHGFFQAVAVSILYAAMLAPLTSTADALALSAAGPPTGNRRHFEYGWVRGAGSAAFIGGALLAGQAIAGVGFDLIVWVSSAFLAAAAGAAAFVSTMQSAAPAGSDAKVDASLRDLLRIREFRLLIVIAALVLGSHAMHDTFAIIRWEAAGISPPTASVLWSESVAAEIAVFVVVGPRVLDRFGPVFAMTVAALAGILRWSVMACTADVTAMVLAEPLHGLSFALRHLACMRLHRALGSREPRGHCPGDLRHRRHRRHHGDGDTSVRDIVRPIRGKRLLGHGYALRVRPPLHRRPQPNDERPKDGSCRLKPAVDHRPR
jgi:PPP family 3-phenylpropionic acid transporter